MPIAGEAAVSDTAHPGTWNAHRRSISFSCE